MCPPFEIGIASPALAGGHVSGDLPVALAFDDGAIVLVASYRLQSR